MIIETTTTSWLYIDSGRTVLRIAGGCMNLIFLFFLSLN